MLRDGKFTEVVRLRRSDHLQYFSEEHVAMIIDQGHREIATTEEGRRSGKFFPGAYVYYGWLSSIRTQRAGSIAGPMGFVARGVL